MGPHAEAILALAVVFGVAGVVAIGLTFLRRRRRFGGDEPACGGCGYIVHPGARRVCPECGADLAAVGVFTPATEPPAFPFVGLYVTSMLCLLVAAGAGPALARLTPWGWDFHAWHFVETTQTQPLSLYNMAGRFEIDARGSGRGWGKRIDRMKVVYLDPARVGQGGPVGVWVEIDAEQQSCRIFLGGPITREPVPIDERAVATAVKAAGFDPADEEGAALCAALREHVHRFLRHDFPPESGSPPFGAEQGIQHRPDQAAAWVAGAAIWVSGTLCAVWLLARRHKRRRAAAALGARRLMDELRLAA